MLKNTDPDVKTRFVIWGPSLGNTYTVHRSHLDVSPIFAGEPGMGKHPYSSGGVYSVSSMRSSCPLTNRLPPYFYSHNPVYARSLDPSVLVFSLSLYRYTFICILFRSRFTSYNKQLGDTWCLSVAGGYSPLRSTAQPCPWVFHCTGRGRFKRCCYCHPTGPSQNRVTLQILSMCQSFKKFSNQTITVSCRAEQLRLCTQQRVVVTVG
jgi:hypothetical protein